MGEAMHPCEKEFLVCRSSQTEKVPKFNAMVFYEDKKPIGKVDEIFGAINEAYFSVKTDPGINPASFAPGTKIYIGDDALLPVKMFLDPPKTASGPRGGGAGGRGRGRGAPRGRGGGRGAPRGGPSRGFGGSGGSRGFGGSGGSRGGSSSGGSRGWGR
jgi:H/ACA ribonucleoprotein complex subunit 1